MRARLATNLENEIEELHSLVKELEYEFVTAISFADRRRIYIEHSKAERDLSSLKCQQEW